MSKFKTMADSYGKLGLYKQIRPISEGSVAGWELIAVEEDFRELQGAVSLALTESVEVRG